MTPRTRRLATIIALALGSALPIRAGAPVPQSPAQFGATAGLTVTPVFEGWYPNPDGTVSLSFGYFNRNRDEALDVAIGSDNRIEPGDANQGQPTHFAPGRHWGVFVVVVPGGATDREVLWTLSVRGETFRIPGHQKPNWRIDALEGEAGSGNTPPVLRFSERGAEGAGPLGVTGEPRTATAGVPFDITVWARDDGRPSGSVAGAGRNAVPVSLTWFLHQGRGSVAFSTPTARVPAAGESATTTVTIAEAGEYVLRVRANDASGVSGAGHAQCCWTNGFVRVVVGR
jgi:hypothetical protein